MKHNLSEDKNKHVTTFISELKTQDTEVEWRGGGSQRKENQADINPAKPSGHPFLLIHTYSLDFLTYAPVSTSTMCTLTSGWAM